MASGNWSQALRTALVVVAFFVLAAVLVALVVELLIL